MHSTRSAPRAHEHGLAWPLAHAAVRVPNPVAQRCSVTCCHCPSRHQAPQQEAFKRQTQLFHRLFDVRFYCWNLWIHIEWIISDRVHGMNVAWGPSITSLIEQCFLCHRYTPLQRSTAVQAASEYDTAHRLHYPQSLTSKFPRHSTKPCTPELGVPRAR